MAAKLNTPANRLSTHANRCEPLLKGKRDASIAITQERVLREYDCWPIVDPSTLKRRVHACHEERVEFGANSDSASVYFGVRSLQIAPVTSLARSRWAAGSMAKLQIVENTSTLTRDFSTNNESPGKQEPNKALCV